MLDWLIAALRFKSKEALPGSFRTAATPGVYFADMMVKEGSHSREVEEYLKDWQPGVSLGREREAANDAWLMASIFTRYSPTGRC
jgi:hypothetical protein